MELTLKRICELQPLYSSSNTPEMQERGRLIRITLVNDLNNFLKNTISKFGNYEDDIGIEGSDGIGRKTEAPWVRIYSKRMSPSPREGFYIVLHFSADGSKVFVTVGCGSTTWKDGDLKAISDEELSRKTSWARQIITERWGTLDPFVPSMALGAKAPLPRTFEKATALAYEISANEINDVIVSEYLGHAIDRLVEIYNNQSIGRDISPGEEASVEIADLSRPLLKSRRGQGFALSAIDRRAIEIHAMNIAISWLQTNGYTVLDRSATKPYDILAIKGSEEYFVEVKGTTSDECKSILMTRNEIDLHRLFKGKTALVIVSKIRLNRLESTPKARGGSIEVFWGWNIDDWRAEAIAFQVFR